MSNTRALGLPIVLMGQKYPGGQSVHSSAVPNSNVAPYFPGDKVGH